MDKARNDKLQRLLDYHLHLDNTDQHRETDALLAKDAEVRQLSESVRKMLRPLASWPAETPPDYLMGRTLQLIEHHDQTRRLAESTRPSAGAGQTADTSRGRGRWILGNLRDFAAVAATIMLVLMVSQPGVRYARNLSNKLNCASQMRQVGVGLSEYALDNDGSLPYVPHQPGATWWNVGNQDANNTSNTRNVFLLVKNGYLPARVFLCPGEANHKTITIQITPAELESMRDFASPDQIDYSFRLLFDQGLLHWDTLNHTVIMTDKNPLFQDLGQKPQGQGDLSLTENLLRANSPNHQSRGQNVLFNDGHVEFMTDRYLGLSQDDIFNIESATRYKGNEVPQSQQDVFVAP